MTDSVAKLQSDISAVRHGLQDLKEAELQSDMRSVRHGLQDVKEEVEVDRDNAHNIIANWSSEIERLKITTGVEMDDTQKQTCRYRMED